MTPKVYTVSQLNNRIASLIASDQELSMLFVEGELSNVNINSKSGHMYFSVKDRSGVIRAVMFSWSVRNLRFRPEDGMKVIMRAQVTVYEPAGQYQLRVEDMQPEGVGALAMQLEQLKKKLSAEGLFAPEHKKPIPQFPTTVGLITSPTGAAIRDLVDILARRFPCAKLVLAPTLVQGEDAPEQLIRAIELFDSAKAADVLIIGRGGGSMEDLWAFNDEGLARAIYKCGIPVISAVGHETDTTLCDFVSDLRAPTPSAAAELAVPERNEVYRNITSIFRHSASAFFSRLDRFQAESEQIGMRMFSKTPIPALENYTELLNALLKRAESTMNNRLDSAASAALELSSKAEALDPLSVINRGFAYVSRMDKNVSSVKDIHKGDILDIRLKDGSVTAEVI